MRDISVDTVQFTTPDKEVINLKDMREYEAFTAQGKYQVPKGSQLDLIAVLVYGEDSEALDYKLFDHNRVVIVDSGYDLDKIKSLEIPN